MSAGPGTTAKGLAADGAEGGQPDVPASPAGRLLARLSVLPALLAMAWLLAGLPLLLVCAAVDGAARIDRSLARRRKQPAGAAWAAGPVALGCVVAMCVAALILVPRFAFGAALNTSFFQQNARMRAAAAADAAVPSGVVVEAVNHLGPQLSARDTVLLWDGDGSSPLRPPWVVADVAKREFTFPSLAAQRQRGRRGALWRQRRTWARSAWSVPWRCAPSRWSSSRCSRSAPPCTPRSTGATRG